VSGIEPVTCPLCGTRFDRSAGCTSACPMSSHCITLCCPDCGYRFVDEHRSMLARFIERLLPRRSA